MKPSGHIELDQQARAQMDLLLSLRRINGCPVLTQEFLESALLAAGSDVEDIGEEIPLLRFDPSQSDHIIPQGSLIRLRMAEGAVFLCPTELIVPNPEQPRIHFDEREMEELRISIQARGQETPIHTTPFTDGTKAGFFLVDGERRWRTLQNLRLPYAKMTVGWIGTREGLLDASFIRNLARADHNPMEIAWACQRKLDFILADPKRKGIGKTAAVLEVGDTYGMHMSTVSRHLQLLKLPREAQELIASGKVKPSHVLASGYGRVSTRTSGDDEFRLQVLASEALKSLISSAEGGADEINPANGGKGRITAAGLTIERRRLLMHPGSQVDARRLEIAEAVVRTARGISTALSGIKILTEPGNRESVIDALRSRGRGKPPESLRDLSAELRSALEIFYPIAHDSGLHTTLEILDGKPTFSAALEDCIVAIKNNDRVLMAKELARTSDDLGTPLISQELGSKTGAIATTVGRQMQLLNEELAPFGLRVDEQIVRREESGGDWKKHPGYRLAWIIGPARALLSDAQIAGGEEAQDSVAAAGPCVDEQPEPAPKPEPAAERQPAPKAPTLPEAELTGSKTPENCREVDGIIIFTEQLFYIDATEALARFISSKAVPDGYKNNVNPIPKCEQKIVLKLHRPSGKNPGGFIVTSNIKGFAINFKTFSRTFASIVKPYVYDLPRGVDVRFSFIDARQLIDY